MVPIEEMSRSEFEDIIYCRDKKVGLNAIIAIHDTTLGPATGGTRMYPYENEKDALTDVMRLAKGMTYKAAISHLPFGGGKSVIIGDPGKEKTPALLKRFGEFVENLDGRYICAKDVGINSADLRTISTRTKHILGVEGTKNSSGDPSPATAFGLLYGIRAIAKEILGKISLEGLRFAIQGVGSVGYYIAKELYQERASLVICDIDQRAIDRCLKELKAEVVTPEKIYDVTCDFFSPCALGAILNPETIPRLKCKIVAGAANNQLASPEDGQRLAEKRIFYAPDYVINAGGLINIAEEQVGYDKKRAFDHVARIYQTMIKIIHRSQKSNIPPFIMADRIAEEIVIRKKKKKNLNLALPLNELEINVLNV